MSSGMSGPGGVPGGGAPGAFAGHPGGGLMGLLSHASVGVTNSQAGGVAAMGGVLGGQQQQHVNMASRARGYSAGTFVGFQNDVLNSSTCSSLFTLAISKCYGKVWVLFFPRDNSLVSAHKSLSSGVRGLVVRCLLFKPEGLCSNP